MPRPVNDPHRQYQRPPSRSTLDGLSAPSVDRLRSLAFTASVFSAWHSAHAIGQAQIFVEARCASPRPVALRVFAYSSLVGVQPFSRFSNRPQKRKALARGGCVSGIVGISCRRAHSTAHRSACKNASALAAMNPILQGKGQGDATLLDRPPSARRCFWRLSERVVENDILPSDRARPHAQIHLPIGATPDVVARGIFVANSSSQDRWQHQHEQ